MGRLYTCGSLGLALTSSLLECQVAFGSHEFPRWTAASNPGVIEWVERCAMIMIGQVAMRN
jgi:hypothetical protein